MFWPRGNCDCDLPSLVIGYESSTLKNLKYWDWSYRFVGQESLSFVIVGRWGAAAVRCWNFWDEHQDKPRTDAVVNHMESGITDLPSVLCMCHCFEGGNCK